MSSQNKHKEPPAWQDIQLPLYRLYQEVRKLDVASGHATVDTQSYLLLLETLRKGYMFASREELLLLCEKLWIKPCHRQAEGLNPAKLHQLFYVHLAELSGEGELPAPPSPPLPPPPKKTRRPKENKRPPLLKEDKPSPPSDLDKTMSQQQGELNITVAAIPGSEETPSPALPGVADQFSGKEFLVRGIYLPVNPRSIEQSIRSYRYRLKGHGRWEVDWDRTVQDIARKGYFDQFTCKEEDQFVMGWTVLIDHSASMAAFRGYSEEIARVIDKGNTGDDDNLFYFQNYPSSHLFYDQLQSASITLEQFAQGPRRNMLVISDAGAARGYFSEDRVKGTLRFLRRMRGHRIAWMNPLPKPRWPRTSAEMIANFTNMFDIGEGSSDNLNNIVRLFKSKITTGKL